MEEALAWEQRAPRGKQQPRKPWDRGGQELAKPRQQMYGELRTLTPHRHLCLDLGQIPQNTHESTSLEAETCTYLCISLPGLHLVASSADHIHSNPAGLCQSTDKGLRV